MAKSPQLAGVALALVSVLGAASYGIVRGIEDSCFKGNPGQVDIYRENGEQIYSRQAPCEQWGENAFVVVNERPDRSFVVADSLPSP
ncbi:MAG: hypothetical protein E6J43_10555 [Chloroflexi bacterium]|nr:MAG: hypothetical protein E6J43_10555 [Chloroflexota bacterium]